MNRNEKRVHFYQRKFLVPSQSAVSFGFHLQSEDPIWYKQPNRSVNTLTLTERSIRSIKFSDILKALRLTNCTSKLAKLSIWSVTTTLTLHKVKIARASRDMHISHWASSSPGRRSNKTRSISAPKKPNSMRPLKQTRRSFISNVFWRSCQLTKLLKASKTIRSRCIATTNLPLHILTRPDATVGRNTLILSCSGLESTRISPLSSSMLAPTIKSLTSSPSLWQAQYLNHWKHL